MVSTELSTLPEQFFHNCVILLVPVDLGLRHQHRDILLEAFVELFQGLLDSLVVFVQSGVLNALGELAEGIDIAIGNQIQFP